MRPCVDSSTEKADTKQEPPEKQDKYLNFSLIRVFMLIIELKIKKFG